MKEVQLFINGEFLDNGDREMRDNVNPATEEVISRFPMATEADVEAAVDAAYEAQKSWEKVPAIERANYLMELVELLKENQELLARTTSEEMGKPLTQAMDEAGWLPAYVQYMAAQARHLKGQIIPSDRPNENIFLYKMPIGVARPDHAVELPAVPHRPQGRSGAHRRLHRRAQGIIGLPPTAHTSLPRSSRSRPFPRASSTSSPDRAR